MGGVNTGDAVSASITNSAFLEKNADDTTAGAISLAKVDPSVSGPTVTNIQKVFNSFSSLLGFATSLAYNALPTWVTNNVGTSTDTLFARVKALDAAFVPLQMTQISTPSAPAAGFNSLYAKSDGNIYYQSHSSGEKLLSGAGGGGGGGSLAWVEDTDSPDTFVEFNNRVYGYGSGLTQNLYALIKVPNGYLAGNPIKLRTDVYTPDTSGTVLIQSVSTLIRQGTDAMTSTTNQRTSTNSAITAPGTANVATSLSLDLTDSTGNINSVAVSAGDYIKVQLTRGSDTAASEARVPVYGSEVTTS